VAMVARLAFFAFSARFRVSTVTRIWNDKV
jgi:hypothetical protein